MAEVRWVPEGTLVKINPLYEAYQNFPGYYITRLANIYPNHPQTTCIFNSKGDVWYCYDHEVVVVNIWE